jgi:putative ABC transport system substrate-binding protein
VITQIKFITVVTLFCSLVLWLAQPAFADYNITIILSSRLEPYIEARQGFESSLSSAIPGSGVKSIQYADIRDFILAEEDNRDELRQKINEHPPQLFVAIGTNALAFLKTTRDTPIIYLMVPFPEGLINNRTNITGVNLRIAPARQLAALSAAMPDIKRIGLIHDPRRESDLIGEIAAAARRRNIDLLIKTATASSDVPALLEAMAGRIDLFWMLPDLTVTTPETIERILLYSLEHRVPVLTFSEKFMTQGAAFAVVFDNQSMGKTAADLARKVLSGAEIIELSPVGPEEVSLRINKNVIEKLGIPLAPETERKHEIP